MRTGLRLILALSFVALAACGGSQTTTGGSSDEDDGRGGRGGRGGGDQVDAGPTEEEIAAQRLAQAQSDFQVAAELYEAGTSGSRDYAEIERRLNAVLENEPNFADAMFNIGVIRYEQGDRAGAIEAYEATAQLDETYARGLANIGYIHLVEGNVAEAEAVFARCIEVSEIEPGCNINLSVLRRMDAGDGDSLDPVLLQQAIDHLRFALGGDANSADAYANLARLYFDRGQLELAQLVCENAILLGIDDAVLHNRLGLIHLANDDVISAYQEFNMAAERQPDYLEALMNIGAMALSFRDYEMSVAAFEQAIALAPDNLDARLSYGVSLKGMDDGDGAEREYCAVLQAQPNNLGVMWNLGLLYQEYYQDYEIAISYYQKYLDTPGGGSTELSEELQRRINVLSELMEAMIEMGEYQPSGRTPVCPA